MLAAGDEAGIEAAKAEALKRRDEALARAWRGGISGGRSVREMERDSRELALAQRVYEIWSDVSQRIADKRAQDAQRAAAEEEASFEKRMADEERARLDGIERLKSARSAWAADISSDWLDWRRQGLGDDTSESGTDNARLFRSRLKKSSLNQESSVAGRSRTMGDLAAERMQRQIELLEKIAENTRGQMTP